MNDLGKKYLVPLQWNNSIPKLLAEFMMVHHLITDLPPELTVMQVGSELARRIDETFEKYSRPALLENDRIREDSNTTMYVTPYDHMTMPFMNDWNQLLVQAVQVPAILSREFCNQRMRLDASEKFVQTGWFRFLPEWKILDSNNVAVEINLYSMDSDYKVFLDIKNRPTNGHAARATQRRIENMTFDLDKPMGTRDYLVTPANKWTFQDVSLVFYYKNTK